MTWSMQRTRSALAGAWAEARVGAAEARLLAMSELAEKSDLRNHQAIVDKATV